MTCTNIIIEDAEPQRGWLQVPLLLLDPDSPHYKGLPVGAAVTYALLRWYYWRGLDWPGAEQAAEGINMALRSMKRHLKELEAVGAIITEKPGQGKPNRYTLPKLKGPVDK